jgi:hypothetical protein
MDRLTTVDVRVTHVHAPQYLVRHEVTHVVRDTAAVTGKVVAYGVGSLVLALGAVCTALGWVGPWIMEAGKACFRLGEGGDGDQG